MLVLQQGAWSDGWAGGPALLQVTPLEPKSGQSLDGASLEGRGVAQVLLARYTPERLALLQATTPTPLRQIKAKML